MKTLREVEPFAYGYMNADCDDIEYRIANGLREYARFIPLEIDGNGLYVTIKDRRNPSFGAVYAYTGISVSKDRFEKSMAENPEIVDAICTKVQEYYYGRAMRVLEAADGEIDIIGSGGDIGGQECLMMHPDT